MKTQCVIVTKLLSVLVIAAILPLCAVAGEVSVVVKAEHLTGTLPNGVEAEVRLKAELQGEDPASLTGEGRHFASTGAHNYWPATGSLSGATVTMSGTVTESNVAYLIGSPLQVTANVETQQITLNFGPLVGGPFAGQTLTFSGTGRLAINSEE
jgi:hypothetical protein